MSDKSSDDLFPNSRVLFDVRRPLVVVSDRKTHKRSVVPVDQPIDNTVYQLLANLPPVYPEWLGGSLFCQAHSVRFPYVAGAMANGIAGVDLVEAMARAKMLSFYGAAGLSLDRIKRDIAQLKDRLLLPAISASTHAFPWGVNLIHAPHDPLLELESVRFFLEQRIAYVSASAYMALTLPVVWYSVAGLSVSPNGNISRKTHLFAKVSRPETAALFMAPPPDKLLAQLVQEGLISERQAQLAKHVPLAEDVTVEADSGGHTDNQSLPALLPTILQLRDDLRAKHLFLAPIRVGAAGGIGTPVAASAAFAAGADYVLTGSINQPTVEADLSAFAKKILSSVSFGDVMMAPAADMFELGVDLQIVKKGTMFGARAKRLRHWYQTYRSIEELTEEERCELEQKILRRSIDSVWNDCESFWAERNADHLTKAANDPKHKMALIFRWYLGMSSRWAISGDSDRILDYQIWSGPALASFNHWVKGSFLEPVASRDVVTVALNILEGAAFYTRLANLRQVGIHIDYPIRAWKPSRFTL